MHAQSIQVEESRRSLREQFVVAGGSVDDTPTKLDELGIALFGQYGLLAVGYVGVRAQLQQLA